MVINLNSRLRTLLEEVGSLEQSSFDELEAKDYNEAAKLSKELYKDWKTYEKAFKLYCKRYEDRFDRNRTYREAILDLEPDGYWFGSEYDYLRQIAERFVRKNFVKHHVRFLTKKSDRAYQKVIYYLDRRRGERLRHTEFIIMYRGLAKPLHDIFLELSKGDIVPSDSITDYTDSDSSSPMTQVGPMVLDHSIGITPDQKDLIIGAMSKLPKLIKKAYMPQELLHGSFIAKKNIRAAGLYQPAGDVLYINPKSKHDTYVHTLVHELIHRYEYKFASRSWKDEQGKMYREYMRGSSPVNVVTSAKEGFFFTYDPMHLNPLTVKTLSSKLKKGVKYVLRYSAPYIMLFESTGVSDPLRATQEIVTYKMRNKNVATQWFSELMPGAKSNLDPGFGSYARKNSTEYIAEAFTSLALGKAGPELKARLRRLMSL
jgi:hypothetical protein